MFASSDGDRRARAVRGCLGVTTRRIRVASEGRPRVRGASRIADGVRRGGRRQGDGWNGPCCPLDDGSTTCPGFDHGRSRFFLTAGESRARENPQAVTAAAKALLISCQLDEVTLRPSNLAVTPADPWRPSCSRKFDVGARARALGVVGVIMLGFAVAGGGVWAVMSSFGFPDGSRYIWHQFMNT